LSTPSIRKLLKVERRPLMLNEASRDVPIEDCRAPGESSVSDE
jgi:hypothetical protein